MLYLDWGAAIKTERWWHIYSLHTRRLDWFSDFSSRMGWINIQRVGGGWPVPSFPTGPKNTSKESGKVIEAGLSASLLTYSQHSSDSLSYHEHNMTFSQLTRWKQPNILTGTDSSGFPSRSVALEHGGKKKKKKTARAVTRPIRLSSPLN